ncbi:MAG: UDP-N-acetylglucosamine acyltransferase [Candidatus Cloacimonadota bacterium]|jgi:UDP-N-acetylglucosamine acyltransferase|nr:UDP-N-acetylglucosamine acyltransferase [Candidatus Cloacimonadota bacterium]
MKKIHPTALVDKNAKIGKDVFIGPNCYIGSNVSLGDGCYLQSNVFMEGHTSIGKNNRFFHSAVIGTIPQDLKYKNDPTKLIIGDNNTFREFATVNISATMDEPTRIGSNCLLMAYSHVAHNCQLADNIIIANSVQLAGHIHIHNNVTIGGMTALHQFVKIGQYAFVGGKSGIKKDVPPYTRGSGFPYRLAGLNTIGLQRKGFPKEVISALKSIYKLFYKSNLNRTQALHIAKKQNLTKEQKIFVDFVDLSERGIARGK